MNFRLASVVITSLFLLLTGCAELKNRLNLNPKKNTGVSLNQEAPKSAVAVSDVQTISFKTGVSSKSVETLAKAAACYSNQGAGLITDAGPVEMYRVSCENGQVFLARCELRQCKPASK